MVIYKKKNSIAVGYENTWEDTLDWVKELNTNLNNIKALENSH